MAANNNTPKTYLDGKSIISFGGLSIRTCNQSADNSQNQDYTVSIRRLDNGNRSANIDFGSYLKFAYNWRDEDNKFNTLQALFSSPHIYDLKQTFRQMYNFLSEYYHELFTFSPENGRWIVNPKFVASDEGGKSAGKIPFIFTCAGTAGKSVTLRPAVAQKSDNSWYEGVRIAVVEKEANVVVPFETFMSLAEEIETYNLTMMGCMLTLMYQNQRAYNSNQTLNHQDIDEEPT